MRLRRPLTLLAALGAIAGTSVATSGATFSSRSTNTGTVTAAADWVPPTVTQNDPGSPLRGPKLFSATAADSGSGLGSVVIQTAPTGTTGFTPLCTASIVASPASCTVDTTQLVDGRYDVRAVATDKAANSATSNVVANRVVDNTAPLVEITDPGDAIRGTVTIAMTASDATSGVASVKLQRAVADSTTWTDVCSDTTAPYSCPLTLPEGSYDLRAIATDVAGNTTTSVLVEDLTVDNTAPAVTMTNPGTPLTGTVPVAATATDALSGVDTVTIQRQANGTTAWIDVCTTTADPYRCSWDTRAAGDGFYSLRAVATDLAGNQTTSAAVTNRQVDNTLATVTLDDPGDVLRGTITLTAQANGLLGVTKVEFQRAPAGGSTFTTICTDTTAPYACSFDTTTVADGLYDLRVVMTYGAGLATKTSAVLSGKKVDNAPLRGVDVKSANKAGGTAGRLEAGDSMNLSWTRSMSPASLVPGWTGAAPVALVATVTDASTNQDVLSFKTAGGAATGLGTVNLKSNFVRSGKTATFTASAALVGDKLTITLGTNTAGSTNLRTVSTLGAMVWTPSATAKDVTNAFACSTTAVTESGTQTVKDF